MKYKIILLLLLPLAFVLQKCQKAPDFPIAPAIVFDSYNLTTINPGKDSLKIKFKFTDGDGDIGFNSGENPSGDSSVFITDVRVGKSDYTYIYNPPHIPEKGSFKQISGSMIINMFYTCHCRPDHVIADTISYKIRIVDRAGHSSNTITTPYVYLKCN
ncbi:MAG: hypothetical protein RJA07_2009 [Bacteroidota bacterium]|jgi:hypothetical protein